MGPLEMTGGGRTVKVESQIDGVLLSRSQGEVVVRPFLYVKRSDIGPDGTVTRDGAELFAESYGLTEDKIVTKVAKGTRLRVISNFGGTSDVVWVYHSGLSGFKMKTPRWFHEPGKVAWTTSAPGLSKEMVGKLKSGKTPSGKKFPYIFLPTWFPQSYTAHLKGLELDDRFGPSYRLKYKNGASWLEVGYATGGIGDRWLEEPAKILQVNHPYFGTISVARLNRGGGVWTTDWRNVPGVLTPSGERVRNGNLGVTFSPDFSEAEITKVLLNLKAVQ